MQSENRMFDDIVKMPIVHSRPLNAQRVGVEGWTLSPFGGEPLTEVTVK